MHEFPQTYDIAPNVKKVPPEFLVGAIVGAGVALLLAPATGSETRRRIGMKAQQIGNGAKGAIGRTRSTIAGIKEDATSAIRAGRESFQRTRESRIHSDAWSSGTT
jgi:gas vesicle protein